MSEVTEVPLDTTERCLEAPVIYFDAIATAGMSNGVASVTLSNVIFTPTTNNGVRSSFVACAHLRTSYPGLLALKAAIEGALLSAMPVEGKGEVN